MDATCHIYESCHKIEGHVTKSRHVAYMSHVTSAQGTRTGVAFQKQKRPMHMGRGLCTYKETYVYATRPIKRDIDIKRGLQGGKDP